ncbi:MAG: HAD-IC family P-type ATPase [Deltaproteobacteria bacterium]|nr:HAD-IC family P-type ATPase [Deltaproteobacteria bacterium]
MNLSQFLSNEQILINFYAKNNLDALKHMVCLLGKVCEKEESIKALTDHESIDGVLLGTGSAIFHSISEDVEDVKIVIAVSPRGIPHPAKKKEKMRILFLIMSPIKESGTHFQILSKLEGFLLNRAFRHRLVSARTKDDVIKAIKLEEGMARDPYIPLSKEEIFSELGTQENGLTEKEALKRLETVGPNVIKRIKKSRLLYDFLHNLTNLFASLLWAGGIMAFIADMPELGWAIFLVIIINAVFSFWQEYKAEKAVEALQKLLPSKVKVLRNAVEKEISADEVVPGDIVILAEGDNIPADGRLIEASDMRVDNSALTGESRPVYKMAESLEDGKNFIWTEMPNLIFAGTGVVSGEGRAVVTATGMDTEIGKIAYLTQAIKDEMSPLQKEMVRVTKTVTAIAIATGIIFFALGYSLGGLSFAASFIFAIGIIVANVPEGLLPTVTLSLAMGVQRMAKKKAIVKKLSAVETLGSTTVICTDKTGTLTTNQMCVERIWSNGKTIEVTGAGYEPVGRFILNDKTLDSEALKHEGIDDLLKAASLCNNAHLVAPLQRGAGSGWIISGDPTEGALIVAAEKAGIKQNELKKTISRVGQIPFERIRKRMTTIHEIPNDTEKGRNGETEILIRRFTDSPIPPFVSFTKGAPRETIDLCTKIKISGNVINLTDEQRNEILKQNDLMASQGLRVLAVAYRDIEAREEYKAEDVEKDLIFLGLLAMVDPPRPEVKDAVSQCHKAGIRVIMITGDYGLTALAIAKQAGIGDNPKIISGAELSRLSHRGLKDILRHGETIFARVEPKDKLRIVEALQDIGEVVAVTGDGVNDAPALKKADIGIAMGMRGSDVAKESAEIILTDDNFATIVEAIKEGRAVYANIKKFVTYIFASNIPEIIPFIAFVMFKIPLPLTVMQILAVDLGTDVVPALGLGVEPPEKGIMDEPPRPRNKRLLDFKLLSRAYLFLGPIEAFLCLAGFYFAYLTRGWQWGTPMPSEGVIYATATTMTLAGIVASQIGNVFACRTEKESVFSIGLFKNRFVLLGILVEVILICLLIYTPFLQKVFGLAPLGMNDLLFLALFPIILIMAEEIRKNIVNRHFSAAKQ